MSTTIKSSGIRVNVTPQMSSKLERLAREEDVSVAHVVRKAIRLYLDGIGPRVVSLATRRRRQIARSTSQTVQAARDARKALQRVSELVSARSHIVDVETDDGSELTDRVPLTDEDRERNLRMALTWLQKAEQETRLLRTMLERLHEHHLTQTLR